MNTTNTTQVETNIALITGGSRGLGREMALQTADKGIDIILTYHSRADEAAKVVNEIEKKGCKAVALQLDTGAVSGFTVFAVNLQAALSKTWKTDRVDFLVNNAGFGGHTLFAETSEAQFDALMNVHFKGVFFLTQTLLPVIRDGGRIVNISSGLARFSFPGASAYASMKGAVEVLSRYLAKELAPRGIAVNVVAPGATETDFNGGRLRDHKDLSAHVASTTAFGRNGLAKDIGGVVASLLTPEMAWVTAQRIEASGGMMI